MVPGAFFYVQEVTVAARLYVGNLASTTTSPDLEAVFGEAGKVLSASVITDRFTGMSRGFGFVEMASNEEAKTAIERFDGYELQGRALKVNEAKPPKARSGGEDRPSYGGGRGGRGQRW